MLILTLHVISAMPYTHQGFYDFPQLSLLYFVYRCLQVQNKVNYMYIYHIKKVDWTAMNEDASLHIDAPVYMYAGAFLVTLGTYRHLSIMNVYSKNAPVDLC